MKKKSNPSMLSKFLYSIGLLKAQKIRRLFAIFISMLPSSALRIKAYEWVFGYSFGKSARVGLLAVIAVDQFVCGEKVLIGRSTSFLGPMQVIIGAKTLIGRWNEFECPTTTSLASRAEMHYARRLVIGKDCLVHEHHFFDLYGEINIGNGTWIAGRDTQFWTHGASVSNRNINIGESCYIGSACRFSPGSGLGNQVVLGLGSVVTKQVEGDNVVVAGVPAKLIRSRDAKRDSLVFERWD
jgi:acetyltransferase-like isoleucine patch superfamily enzyme